MIQSSTEIYAGLISKKILIDKSLELDQWKIKTTLKINEDLQCHTLLGILIHWPNVHFLILSIYKPYMLSFWFVSFSLWQCLIRQIPNKNENNNLCFPFFYFIRTWYNNTNIYTKHSAANVQWTNCKNLKFAYSWTRYGHDLIISKSSLLWYTFSMEKHSYQR